MPRQDLSNPSSFVGSADVLNLVKKKTFDSVQEVTFPSFSDALSGIKKDPDHATDGEKEAIKFLYKLVLPAMTGNIKGRTGWTKGASYWQIFGDKYSFQMATAFVLMQHDEFCSEFSPGS